MKKALMLVILFPSLAFASEVSDAAEKYCECAKPMYKEMENVMAVLRGGDPSQLQNMQATMQEKATKLESCMNDLQDQYNHLRGDESFETAMKKEIEKVCPRPKIGVPGMG